MRVQCILPAVACASLLAAPVAAEDGWPREITDVNGYSVTLDAPAQRTAVLPPPLGTFAVSLAEGPERIMSVHPWTRAIYDLGILPEYYPEIRDIPARGIGQGFAPNIEELLELNPDMIFYVGFVGEDKIRILEESGLPFLTINVNAADDAHDWIPMMGAVYGSDEKAARMLEWRKEVEAGIREKLAGLADADRPKVAHINSYGEQLRVVGAKHFRSWQIELAGGVNVASDVAQYSAQINAEQLFEWDPDIILLHTFDPDLTPQKLFDDPVLNGLRAVREGRVYGFPIGADRWEAPVAESPLAWMWLAELFHPELFDWDFPAEIRSAHEFLFGHTPGDGAAAVMLRAKDNAESAGYDRFLDH